MRHRLDALRADVDGWCLLTDGSDVRWASGFSGSNGWLLVGPSSSTLLTDARYTERALQESSASGVEVVTAGAPSAMHEAVVRLAGHERVGCRSSTVSFEHWSALCEAGVRLIHHDSSHLRRVKDPDELVSMTRAAEIASQALSATLPLIGVGTTERDIRDELDYRIRRLGADGPSYDTIVATGTVNSSIPHHHPSRTPLRHGDSLVIDVGALIDGYHSDMTRTFFVGDPPDELAKWYEILLEAQHIGLRSIRSGIAARDVDLACRTALGADAEYFVHGTGHGVGLDIHEPPFLNRLSDAVLMAGEVVTVEPGLYRRGLGGIRIEDLVVVREDSAEILTTFPKELTCLPSRPMT